MGLSPAQCIEQIVISGCLSACRRCRRIFLRGPTPTGASAAAGNRCIELPHILFKLALPLLVGNRIPLFLIDQLIDLLSQRVVVLLCFRCTLIFLILQFPYTIEHICRLTGCVLTELLRQLLCEQGTLFINIAFSGGLLVGNTLLSFR